jgi:S1-C subfamily serine protease
VVSVESGGLAERIGLQKGDRITSVNGEDVRHPEDVRRALAGNTGNVKIRFQRAGTSHEVSFERS